VATSLRGDIRARGGVAQQSLEDLASEVLGMKKVRSRGGEGRVCEK